MVNSWVVDGTMGIARIMGRAERFAGLVCGSNYVWSVPLLIGKPIYVSAANKVCTAFIGMPKDPETLDAWVRNG